MTFHQAETIFTAFEQLDGSNSREYGGTGLGLAITRRLIELQGGSLHVDSKEGEGSTFSFTLPIASSGAHLRAPRPFRPLQTVPAPIPADPVLQVKAGRNRGRILVVDDEQINRKILENMLTPRGYQTTLAESGQQALDLIKTRPFDLILLDIMMPRVTGYEVCREVRSRFSLHDLPVVFLTAKNQISDMRTGFDMGANDYITKPFAKEELLSRVHLHLSLLEAHREMEGKVADRTRELQTRNKELSALNTMAGTINREFRLKDVMPAILEQGMSLFPQAQTGSIMLLDDDRMFFRVVATTTNFTQDMFHHLKMTREQAFNRYVEGAVALEQDITLIHDPDDATRPEVIHQLPKPTDLLAMAFTLNGVVEGYLILDHSGSERGFDERDVNRLVHFRELAISAIARARVLKNLADTQKDLVQAAHMFGMAENAKEVLHHLGNKLNSVNTSVQVLHEMMENKQSFNLLERTRSLYDEHPDLLTHLKKSGQELLFSKMLYRLITKLTSWKGNVTREVDRLEQSVQRVLHALRTQWSYTTIKSTSEPADINQLVRGCLQMEGFTSLSNKVEIIEKLEPLPPIRVHKIKLVRIISEILKNAMEAVEGIEEKGRLRLLSRMEGETVVIEIADNGVGIPAENIDKLFTQGFSTKNRSYEGFGLHNCANAVMEMNGKLIITSEGIGKGASATITLPLDNAN